MIIQEENKNKENKEYKKKVYIKLKEILDVNLPKGYCFRFFIDDGNYDVELWSKGFLREKKAYVDLEKLDDDIILVNFEKDCEEELDDLRDSFDKSSNKFKIKISEW